MSVGGSPTYAATCKMPQTMCPDPYPVCPRKECGYPISGCRDLGCASMKCRHNQHAQGVELKYRPVSEFEFHEKFDTQEMPWRSSRGVASPNYGYEVPYKPSRHFFSPDLIAQPRLQCNAIPSKDQPWRAQRKTFPGQTGALSGDDAIRHRKFVPPAVVDEKEADAATHAPLRFYEASSQTMTKEKNWKPARHISGKSGCETTQQDFHPHRRHIPKEGSTATVRPAKKAPGVYKRDDGEWLPPFRATTPEMVAHQTPGCVPWQCPKRRGKKPAPDCRRQGEWQPDFRSCNTSVSAPPTPETHHRPTSRQGLKHCQCRPDEWCPPWKQQQQHQQQRQQPTSHVDGCDALSQRNATINEEANCTHYLDDDRERDGLGQQERQAGAESTEEEDGDEDGEEEDEERDGEEEDDGDDEPRKADPRNPSQKAVDEYYASVCDACDPAPLGAAGGLPRAINSCWSAAEVD